MAMDMYQAGMYASDAKECMAVKPARVGGLSSCIKTSHQLREMTELLSQVVGDKLGGLMTVQPAPAGSRTMETPREELAPIPEEIFRQLSRSIDNVGMVIDLIKAMDV